MFNTEVILKKISDRVITKLVEYGSTKVLIELGFQVGAYSNDIVFNDNNNSLIDNYIAENSKEILEHIQKELDTKLHTEIRKILMNKVMTKMVEAVRNKISENIEAMINDRLDYYINNKYVNAIQEEVDIRIMEDPIIKAAMIKRL